jgi:hypothetical protein
MRRRRPDASSPTASDDGCCAERPNLLDRGEQKRRIQSEQEHSVQCLQGPRSPFPSPVWSPSGWIADVHRFPYFVSGLRQDLGFRDEVSTPVDAQRRASWTLRGPRAQPIMKEATLRMALTARAGSAARWTPARGTHAYPKTLRMTVMRAKGTRVHRKADPPAVSMSPRWRLRQRKGRRWRCKVPLWRMPRFCSVRHSSSAKASRHS